MSAVIIIKRRKSVLKIHFEGLYHNYTSTYSLHNTRKGMQNTLVVRNELAHEPRCLPACLLTYLPTYLPAYFIYYVGTLKKKKNRTTYNHHNIMNHDVIETNQSELVTLVLKFNFFRFISKTILKKNGFEIYIQSHFLIHYIFVRLYFTCFCNSMVHIHSRPVSGCLSECVQPAYHERTGFLESL